MVIHCTCMWLHAEIKSVYKKIHLYTIRHTVTCGQIIYCDIILSPAD